MFAAIRRASSRKVLEINYGRWGFQERVSSGAVHEAFAIYCGSFRGCLARRFPPPWSAEVTPNCLIVRDANGQARFSLSARMGTWFIMIRARWRRNSRRALRRRRSWIINRRCRGESRRAALMTAYSEMFPLMNRNGRIALGSILSQCWGCDAHGCNCSAKNQL
jgi:hypothetical protein